MRWESLFADLEGQLEQEDAAELAAEVAERTRREHAGARLADRVRAVLGGRLTVHLVDGSTVAGTAVDAVPDWLLLEPAPTARVLVPTGAVAGVEGLGRQVAAPAGVVAARLGLGSALRALARDRAVVRVSVRGGQLLTGTFDRVGADHVDLAQHPADVPRRAGAVTSVRTLPFSALVAVRTA